MKKCEVKQLDCTTELLKSFNIYVTFSTCSHAHLRWSFIQFPFRLMKSIPAPRWTKVTLFDVALHCLPRKKKGREKKSQNAVSTVQFQSDQTISTASKWGQIRTNEIWSSAFLNHAWLICVVLVLDKQRMFPETVSSFIAIEGRKLRHSCKSNSV